MRPARDEDAIAPDDRAPDDGARPQDTGTSSLRRLHRRTLLTRTLDAEDGQ